MIVFILLAAVWLGLGWIGAAYIYNYFQSEWFEQAADTESKDATFFWLVLAGPITILSVLTYEDGVVRQYGPRFFRYKYIDGVRQ